MKKYKIIVAYDGTDYHGWQIQPHNLTICQILQDRFYSVFGKKIKIIGASRTDAGVHALGQVAMFNIDFIIDLDVLKMAWNNLLPDNIIIRKIDEVDELFHPQENVKQKTYYYHIFQNRPLPFISRYGYFPNKLLNENKLKDALQIFVGKHDFRSFCTGYEQESTIRTIDSIDIVKFKRFGVIRIEIKAQSFLRYMIRRIVGASLDIACSYSRSVNELQKALEQKNPEQQFTTAPAKGLLLYKIIYK